MAYGRRRYKRRTIRRSRRRPLRLRPTVRKITRIPQTPEYNWGLNTRPTTLAVRGPAYARTTFVGRFMPFKQLCRFVYCETITSNSTANPTGSVETLIYPQFIVDPLNHGDYTHAPAQYVEAMTHYKYCTVQGAKITVRRMIQAIGATTTSGYWGLVRDNASNPKYDLTGLTYDDIEMMAGVPSLKLAANNTHVSPGFSKGNFATISHSAKKFFGITKKQLNKPTDIEDDNIGNRRYSCSDSYAASGYINTRKPVIKLVHVPPNLSTHDSQPEYFQIKIEFIALLSERKIIIES